MNHSSITINGGTSKFNGKLSFDIVNNQLSAMFYGRNDGQSYAVIKENVRAGVHIVLDPISFEKGIILHTDIVSITRLECGKNEYLEKIEHHYMELFHDNISERASKFSAAEITELCLMTEGNELSRCMSNLRNALSTTQFVDAYFFCFRAIEIMRFHISTKHGVSANDDKRKQQWKKFNEILGLDESDATFVRDFSCDVRHGKSIESIGSEWLEVIEKTWEITEKYIQYLQDIANGIKSWTS